MKYLDEIIEAYATDTSTAGQATGIYQYRVQRKDDSNNTYTTIFVGNMYHSIGSQFFVDITDIVKSDTWVPSEDFLYNTNSDGINNTINLVNTYKVVYYMDSSTTKASSDIKVAKIYKYPHSLSNLGNPPFFDSLTTTVVFPLQGRVSASTVTYRLTPKYPYKSTSNYRMLLTSHSYSGAGDSAIATFQNGLTGTFSVPISHPTSFISYNLSTLYNNASSGSEISTTPKLKIGNSIVAHIDTCVADYYLQWQDRYGSFQSQPFNKHFTYSEELKRENTTDYKGVKKMSSVEVTSKFKINTDWIKDDYYPFYESIFTSPVLFLYDTNEDKRYSVLVKDSEYTEKTFDNQKRMFNLTLDLELNKTQNIIY